jgi:hypothetical protein
MIKVVFANFISENILQTRQPKPHGSTVYDGAFLIVIHSDSTNSNSYYGPTIVPIAIWDW